jgi:flagellar biosynthesis protein FlhA
MDPGTVQNKVRGIATTEPVYGLPASWISPEDKEQAELSGYTVIDPESVFMTHLSESLRQHADELLTREDVQQLIERLRKSQPSLVGESLGANGEVPVGLLQRVLRNLLREQVPIREMTTILEALAENASKSKNPTVLTEMVRKSLCRTITQQFRGKEGKILALTFEPALEHQMTSMLRQEAGELRLALPSELALEVSRRVGTAWKGAMDKGLDRVVLLCDARLRYSLAEMLARTVRLLPVIAYDEIVLGTEVEPVATIDVSSEAGVKESRGQLVGAGAS